jgi:hypothetical protein
VPLRPAAGFFAQPVTRKTDVQMHAAKNSFFKTASCKKTITAPNVRLFSADEGDGYSLEAHLERKQRVIGSNICTCAANHNGVGHLPFEPPM